MGFYKIAMALYLKLTEVWFPHELTASWKGYLNGDQMSPSKKEKLISPPHCLVEMFLLHHMLNSQQPGKAYDPDYEVDFHNQWETTQVHSVL